MKGCDATPRGNESSGSGSEETGSERWEIKSGSNGLERESGSTGEQVGRERESKVEGGGVRLCQTRWREGGGWELTSGSNWLEIESESKGKRVGRQKERKVEAGSVSLGQSRWRERESESKANESGGRGREKWRAGAYAWFKVVREREWRVGAYFRVELA